MKKLLLLIFTITSFSALKSQNWCAPGATWYYRLNQTFGAYCMGYVKFTATNTVTILNTPCYQIEGRFSGQTMSASHPTITNAPWMTLKNSQGITTYQNKSTGK